MKFDDARIKKIAELSASQQEESDKEWSATAIFEKLDAAIIGNANYKKSLALCLGDYLGKAKIRNHLLVVGPSGTGKTYLIEKNTSRLQFAIYNY